jgi:hypothetical protein
MIPQHTLRSAIVFPNRNKERRGHFGEEEVTLAGFSGINNVGHRHHDYRDVGNHDADDLLDWDGAVGRPVDVVVQGNACFRSKVWANSHETPDCYPLFDGGHILCALGQLVGIGMLKIGLTRLMMAIAMRGRDAEAGKTHVPEVQVA